VFFVAAASPTPLPGYRSEVPDTPCCPEPHHSYSLRLRYGSTRAPSLHSRIPGDHAQKNLWPSRAAKNRRRDGYSWFFSLIPKNNEHWMTPILNLHMTYHKVATINVSTNEACKWSMIRLQHTISDDGFESYSCTLLQIHHLTSFYITSSNIGLVVMASASYSWELGFKILAWRPATITEDFRRFY
jgi:hypothetical protein